MKQTTLRLPDNLHKRLKEEAERRGLTLNAYVIGVLWKESKLEDTSAAVKEV